MLALNKSVLHVPAETPMPLTESNLPASHTPSASRCFTTVVHWIGLMAGPAVAAIVYFLLRSHINNTTPLPTGALSHTGLLTLCIGIWMAIWWVTEPVAAAVTALLPITLFPVLGVLTFRQAASGYVDNLVVLFFAGFILGEAVQKWGLHKRFALLTVLAFGTRPSFIVLGILCATAVISMWVSNTAAAVMMMPIALSLGTLVSSSGIASTAADTWSDRSARNFTICLLLAVSYGASLGGMGTPIGTPPNLQMSAYASEVLHRPISFSEWMRIAVPILVLCIPIVWILLVRLHPTGRTSLPGGRAILRENLRKLGPLSREEWGVLIVFILAAVCWIARQPVVDWLNDSARAANIVAIEAWDFANTTTTTTTTTGPRPAPFAPREYLSDAGIGLVAVLILFVVPFRARTDSFLVQWKDCAKISWGTLLLFGGGLSLAAAMKATGLEGYLGTFFESLRGIPRPLFLLLLAVGIVALSEVASNTALAAAIIPILGTAAKGLGMDPIALLMVATLAASCGFALPVATPPNAIAYATGRIPLGRMIRMGLITDAVCILVIVGVFAFFGEAIFRFAGITPPAP